MRSLGWALAHFVWCPYKKGRLDTKTHTGRTPCEEGRGKCDTSRAKECQSASKPPETRSKAWGRFLHPSEEFSSDKLILAFSLQDCETINFCFKPLSLWYFVVAALGNEFSGFKVSCSTYCTYNYCLSTRHLSAKTTAVGHKSHSKLHLNL